MKFSLLSFVSISPSFTRYHSYRSFSNIFHRFKLNSFHAKPKYLLFHQRYIFVQIDKTPNVLSLKFTPAGHSILPNDETSDANTLQTLQISSYKQALKMSPLARELIVIDGISNVFLAQDFVTVSVADTNSWPDIQGQIVSVINDFLLSGKPVLEETFALVEDSYSDEDDEVIAIIRELIDTRIRPNVQYDGGDIIYRGFDHETGILNLELVGACKGCSSSKETLHNGIERMLQFYVPEVSQVIEVGDDEEDVDEDQARIQEISRKALEKVEQKNSQK